MWRQCDVAFLSTFILLLFLRIYQNLSTNFPSLFLLNITTQCVRHHSPLTTSLSLLFVRWTREGLLERRSVHYLIWTVVTGSLDSVSLAISPIVPDLPVMYQPSIGPVINSDQPCSVQALACTRNLQTEVGLPLIFFLFYFIYYHPMYQINILFFCSVIFTHTSNIWTILSSRSIIMHVYFFKRA